jgi:hypothetical protein
MRGIACAGLARRVSIIDMRYGRLPAFSLFLTVAFSALAPIDGFAGHAYSFGTDGGSYGGGHYYSGVSVQRYDADASTTVNNDCGINANPPVVSDSMWLTMGPPGTPDFNYFLEMGTAQKTCSLGPSHVKWWYAFGSIPNGYYGFLWTQQIFGVYQHRFFLFNGPGAQDSTCTHGQGGCWEWWIDQTEVNRYFWPAIGAFAQIGLESQDTGASVPSRAYNGMVKEVNWSSWLSWVPSQTPTSGSGQCTQPPPSYLWCSDPGLSGNYADNTDGWGSQP